VPQPRRRRRTKAKREELLEATEAELGKVRSMVEGARGSLRKADAGKIGTRAGKVANKYKVSKHFELEIADGAFSYSRKAEQIAAEAALDGLYVIRTTCTATKLPSSESVVRTYKQAERAFRTMKDQISTTTSPIASASTPSCACSPTTSPSSCT